MQLLRQIPDMDLDEHFTCPNRPSVGMPDEHHVRRRLVERHLGLVAILGNLAPPLRIDPKRALDDGHQQRPAFLVDEV